MEISIHRIQSPAKDYDLDIDVINRIAQITTTAKEFYELCEEELIDRRQNDE